MQPDEFLQHLRGRVVSDMPRWLTFIRRELEGKTDEDEVNQWLESFKPRAATVLAEHRLLPPERVERTQRLMLAVSKSRRMNDYMRGASQSILMDKRYVEISQHIVTDPNALSRDDLEYFVERTTSDDSMITGAIRTALSDDGIRRALGLPADFSVDEYLVRLRRQMREARSWEEFTASDPLTADLFASCTAIVVCLVSVLAAAHAWVLAYTQAAVAVLALAVAAVWVWLGITVVASGFDSAGTVASGRKVLPDSVRSVVHNRSKHHVWVVAGDPLGLKRAPLGPGWRTTDLGLARVEAIVIGGKGNDLAEVSDEGGVVRRQGAYLLGGDLGDPAEVTVEDDGAEGVRLSVNARQQHAVSEGRAGYCDQTGAGPAGERYDPRYAMDRTAAVVPAGFGLASASSYAAHAEHYYQVLRTTNVLGAVPWSLGHA